MRSLLWSTLMVCDCLNTLTPRLFSLCINVKSGSRGPAVLDDFTSSYGYKFSDPAGYQWGGAQSEQNKL